MAVELRDKGIRVTAINPGPVRTGMFLASSKEQLDYMNANLPIANPEDIADIIAFLASPKSRWVNGGVINANNAVAF